MKQWKEGLENLKHINLKSKLSVLIFPVLSLLPYVILELQKRGNAETASLVRHATFAVLWIAVYLAIRFHRANRDIFRNRYSRIIFLCIILLIALPTVLL
ncbi:MAG: hypothetical protein J6E42_01440 [Firmicutes bacterium]|nr:hypothetical protein [Bacillota bacterium]